MPDLDDIAWIRDNSPDWRLLRADNAPLVLSFLYQVFVADNIRSISATELASRLDDELYALNQRESKRYPKSSRAYLDDWAAPGAGWLRKYYPDDTDEPHFDATPAVEKALQWVQSLREREFVGTESRLNVIFELLRQIAFGTETDPGQRLAELRRQRQEIDEQIARVQSGELPLLDDTSVRDRYQQFAGTARELFADFREVEENFRKLDRQLREKIAGWRGGKGELLDDPSVASIWAGPVLLIGSRRSGTSGYFVRLRVPQRNRADSMNSAVILMPVPCASSASPASSFAAWPLPRTTPADCRPSLRDGAAAA